MNKTLILAFILFALSGCSAYEYVRVDSPAMTKNEKKELIWENDSVRLVYNFHGKNGPLKLYIYNKTDKALFIDWKRCAMIREQQSISLFDSRVIVDGSISSVPIYASRRISYVPSSFNASFNLPEGTDMIAPKAYIAKALLNIYAGRHVLDPAKADSLPENKIWSDLDSRVVKYKTISYDDKASPFQFTLYLTLFTGSDNKGEFTLSHPFYISQVLRAKLHPDEFSMYVDEGNQFYHRTAVD